MLAAARLVTAAAHARRESRGAHWRSDFPKTAKQGSRSFMTPGRRRQRNRSAAATRAIVSALDRPPSALLIEPLSAGRWKKIWVAPVTSRLISRSSPDAVATAKLVARQHGTVAGLIAAEIAFRAGEPTPEIRIAAPDGSKVKSGALLATVSGPARSILTAERVALNFAGISPASPPATAALVDAVAGTGARIVCTRKTLPGLRTLQKYAVRCGGGLQPPLRAG